MSWDAFKAATADAGGAHDDYDLSAASLLPDGLYDGPYDGKGSVAGVGNVGGGMVGAEDIGGGDDASFASFASFPEGPGSALSSTVSINTRSLAPSIPV